VYTPYSSDDRMITQPTMVTVLVRYNVKIRTIAMKIYVLVEIWFHGF